MCDNHAHPDPVQHLVNEWEHGAMNRREFFQRALFLLGSATAAEALLAACSPAVVPSPTSAPVAPVAQATPTAVPPTPVPPTPVPPTPVPPTPVPATPTRPPQPTPAPFTPPPTSALPGYVDAAAVDFSEVNYPSGDVKMIGYLAKPKTGSGPWPAVITIHENRGITDHHKEVARRVANLGYVALSVDFLSRLGGSAKYANPPEDPTRAIGQLQQADINKDIVASVAYLKTLSFVKPKFGIMGFCWGGGNALNGAIAASPDIVATIVFYGRNPANLDDVAKINGPVLGIYAENDQGINGGIPALVEAMKKHNKSFEYKNYPGTQHAFFNDSGPRFVESQAKEAWARLVEFFKKNLT
jgi:carboxymethylenebutenolidase